MKPRAHPPIPASPGQGFWNAPNAWVASRWVVILQTTLIIATGLWVYWPALGGTWVWDDDHLVVYNETLRNFLGLWKIWFATPETDYWPLTWTTLWVQWHLWGNWPLGYHLFSLSLHLLSGFLIWRLFAKLGLRWGWLGGLFFVVHPLAVESVAWISEIKNTLSLPFFLLSTNAFIDTDNGKKHYLRSILYYLAGMLCKTSVVMLPPVLLLYCWWKRGRITQKDFKATIPYFLIAFVLGLVTVYFQVDHTPDEDAVSNNGIVTKLICAATALYFYLGKFLLPIGLLPIYPRWSLDPPSVAQTLTLPVLLILLWGLWKRRNGWGRHALLGFGFFLVTVTPALGFITMAYMNISWVADHLVYLPIIGLIGLTVAALETVYRSLSSRFRPFMASVVGIIVLLLAWESHFYAGLFISPESLWNYTIVRNPNGWVAHGNLGLALMKIPGRLPDAITQLEEARDIRPDYAETHSNLGTAFSEVPSRIPDAISEYEAAIKIKPNLAVAHNNLGNALSKVPGRLPDAIGEFRKAIQINPEFAVAHFNLGLALASTPNQLPDAIYEYEEALRLQPDYMEAHYKLGYALSENPARLSEAVSHFQSALRIKPGQIQVLNDMANTLSMIQGRLPEAISAYEEALRLRPDLAETHFNLGNAFVAVPGRLPDAIKEYQEALQLKPDMVQAHVNLAYALSNTPGRSSEAIGHLETALRINPNFVPARQMLEEMHAHQH